MIELGLHKPTEIREKGYSDLILDSLVARAETAAADAGKSAATEAVSGLVARSFAAAKVETASAWQGVLRPYLCSDMARRMIRKGEFVGLVSTDPARIEPVFDYDFDGEIYSVTLSHPKKSITMQNVSRDRVIHARYSADQHQPWIGRSPMEWARSTSVLTGAVEQALADESGSPHGYVMGVAAEVGSRKESGVAGQSFTEKLKVLKGRLLVQPVRSTGPKRSGEELHAVAQWATSRVGFNPPETLISLARQNYEHALSVFGLNPAFFLPTTQVGQREALRSAVHTLFEPLGNLLADALSETLETPVAFDFAPLAGIDHQGRARAVKALVDAGVTLEDALERVVW